MAKQDNMKICFVIAPIGDAGTETRRRSDQILKHVIGPATEECGYQTVRADRISEPGMITFQIIQHLIDDDLVIADLTGKNPNVFYELAVRHAVKKPVVQIIQAGESIPFDVATTRTIPVDHKDLDSVAICQGELTSQIRSVERDPSKVDSPISVAIDLQSLHRSDNPVAKSNAEIIFMLQDLRSAVSDLTAASKLGGGYGRPQFNLATFEKIFMLFDNLRYLIVSSEGQKLTKTQVDKIRYHLDKLETVIHVIRNRAIGMELTMSPSETDETIDRIITRTRPRRIKLK